MLPSSTMDHETTYRRCKRCRNVYAFAKLDDRLECRTCRSLKSPTEYAKSSLPPNSSGA